MATLKGITRNGSCTRVTNFIGQKPSKGNHVVRMSIASASSPDQKSSAGGGGSGNVMKRQMVEIPRMEPFSVSKIERRMKEPSLIQKTEKAIMDYCCTREGDEGYKCWEAYFLFQDMKKECVAQACSATCNPYESLESLVRSAGGVKSLIEMVHFMDRASKRKKQGESEEAHSHQESLPFEKEGRGKRAFPVPDELPKTVEEMEDDEKGKMPDSPYTRLLRRKGGFPAWFTPRPDHETD